MPLVGCLALHPALGPRMSWLSGIWGANRAVDLPLD